MEWSRMQSERKRQTDSTIQKEKRGKHLHFHWIPMCNLVKSHSCICSSNIYIQPKNIPTHSYTVENYITVFFNSNINSVRYPSLIKHDKKFSFIHYVWPIPITTSLLTKSFKSYYLLLYSS
jgi:hypothetical protein